MATEARRRCGYRKVGGLYLMGSGEGAPCDRLPIPVSVCPCCNQGIKQARGWTWLDLGKFFDSKAHQDCHDTFPCPLCDGRIEKAGLLWIGEKFYPTPADFLQESREMGMSRRITAVPRGFKAGETWVLLAHPKAVTCSACAGIGSLSTDEYSAAGFHVDEADAGKPVKCQACDGTGKAPGIFYVLRPDRIEKIITETQSHDAELMADLEKKGITPVIVPDNDRDHQGTVYDKEEAEEPAAEAKPENPYTSDSFGNGGPAPADGWLWQGGAQ